MTDHLVLRKSSGRYYVEVDGIQAGWVLKGHEGGWTFVSTIDDSLKGEVLTKGNATRRDAIMEGLSCLRIHHLGRVCTLNRTTWKDEFQWIEEAVLRSIWADLLDEKYPMPA